MSYPVYYPLENDVLPHLFSSYDGATGASEALSGLAVTDIEIYKDGGVTQRSSDAGYTLLDTDGTDFDGLTGINGFSIDLSDNTDAGFFTVGPWYHVVVAGVTVDGVTVNFVACAFRILSAAAGMAGTDLAAVAAKAAQLTFTNANQVDATALTLGTGTVDAAALASNAVDEILDEPIGDSAITLREAIRVILAAVAGKASGLDTYAPLYRNVADTKNVISATTDADGNRSAVTLNP